MVHSAQSPGDVIAAARRERGWTQQRLADLCGYSQSTISRLERGRQSARDVDVLALVADRLGIPRTAVGLAANHPASAHNGSVKRRNFFGTTAAAVLGIPPATEARHPVSPAVVRHLRRLRATLVQSDSLYGPQCVISAVHDHLSVVENQLLPNATGTLRNELLQAAAEWAEFAGWLSEDLGQPEVGLWWSDRAMEWAQEADDPVRQAFILMRKAQQSNSLLQQQRAIGLARASLQVRGEVPPRVRASAHLQEAHGHALAGDTTAAYHALDMACEMVEGSTAATGRLADFCTPPYVAAQRAACQLRLGQPATAVATYSQALDAWPSTYQRERGLHLARLAAAQAGNREPDAACTIAMEALEIARETQSHRALAELRCVVTGLTPWKSRAAVRELADAVIAV